MAKASATIDVTALKVAGEGASKYITDIGNDGIKVHDATSTAGSNFVKINSNGMKIYRGGDAEINVVANFSTTTTIGKTNQSHLELSSNALILYDGATTPQAYFKIRDAVNESGQVIDTFIGIEGTQSFSLSYVAQNTSYQVTRNGELVTPSNKTTTSFRLTTQQGDEVVATYNVVNNTAKGYDFGIRKPNSITGVYSIIEGVNSAATGNYSHAENNSTASGNSSHAENRGCASGNYSHAENTSTASGDYSHAEGYGTASGNYSHAENRGYASGNYSHAEGYRTVASGNYSHAEGERTYARAIHSHAEGLENRVSGDRSHVEGSNNIVTGAAAHGGGYYTITAGNAQTVIGRYNIEDTESDPDVSTIYGKYALIIGNGDPHAPKTEDPDTGEEIDPPRSNVLTVDWHGLIQCYGKHGIDTGLYTYSANSSDVERHLGYIIGSGGDNAGIYDYNYTGTGAGSDGAWMIYSTRAETHVAVGNFIVNNGNIQPNTTNKYSCGASGKVWTAVYARNTTIQTSDAKQKDIIGTIDYAKDLIMNLKPIEYQWKDSDHNRIHMGLIAQDVAKVGRQLDKNLSLYQANYKDINKKYNGEEVDDSKLDWSLGYGELIAPMIKVIQDQEKRIQQLEEQLLQK